MDTVPKPKPQDPNKALSAKLNRSVLAVLGGEEITGFEKAYQISSAIAYLKNNLNDDYMVPIMALQGSKLGFKTDKDKEKGYPMTVVRECLIDAVLTGVQPYGNQFNIIAGQMYVTKEGYAHLLKNIDGLKYQIKAEVPRISADKGSATVEMVIKWKYNNVENEEKVEFAIKVNNFMGADAVIGKATRKARAWLFNQISPDEVSDGDAEDVEFTVVSNKPIEERKADLKARTQAPNLP